MRSVGKTTVTRDVTVTVASDSVANAVRKSVERLAGVRLVSVSDSTFLAHLGGKISIVPKIPVKTRTDLAKVYTPRRRTRSHKRSRPIRQRRSR